MNGVGNGLHRGGSPRSRRPFQIRRPMTTPANRRLTNQSSSVVRHTPRRMIPKIALSSDAIIQRGNIQVAVRVRPTNDAEAVAAHRNVVQVVDEHMVIFDPKEQSKDFFYHGKRQQNNNSLRRNKEARFVFDRVFSTISTNQEVFEGTIKRSLDTLLEGFNCSVFAYGATGSGKTFTMLGSGDSNPGLTILTMIDLYCRLEEMEAEYETSVTVSYLEVYNESVRDLLNPAPTKTGPINILEDENGVSIPNLTTLKPLDQKHLLEVLSEGNRRRTQHPTDHNAESSRSHAVFQVHVTIRARFTDLNKSIRSAKLVMVDLAGSERGSATGCNGDRFREGASINKSLLALGNCINALADGKKHVPYRDSKLTRLLKDSLGGNCKTIIIANVSPSSLSYDDTHNTLKYANRAKHIRVNVKKNEFTVSARLAEYSKVIQEMQDRINTLAAENELYKVNCKCLTSKESTSDESDAEGRDETDGISTSKGVVAFKNLKRRYEETRGMLSLTDTKIETKKARLNGIGGNGDVGATKGLQKLQRQLTQLEETRLALQGNFQQEKIAVENAVSSVSAEATVPIPLSEVLRLHGLEVRLETLERKRDQEKSLLLQENARAQNLLSRSMALVKSVYQLSHVQKQTTKKQDKDYEELRLEYLGYTKVRWADQEPPKTVTTISDLNTTYAISLE